MRSTSELRAEARHFKDELLGHLSVQPRAAGERRSLPRSGNILGVGYGAKRVGRGMDGLAVRVYVRTKRPRAALSRTELVPDSVDGRPTDVVEVGDVVSRGRPVRCGVSIGHVEVTAGTLGGLVEREDDALARYLLSNNHVIANSNDAEVGDAVLEPARLDGGDPDDPIAELTAWVPIRFDGDNEVDAAIARLRDPADVLPEIEAIGPLRGEIDEPALYQSVRKHGRTTGHTVGVVLDIAADIQVRFGPRIAMFTDQYGIVGAGGTFSDGGDSGSLVVDAVGHRPVGLLFAGGGDTTFCNPIGAVLKAFDADLVDGGVEHG